MYRLSSFNLVYFFVFSLCFSPRASFLFYVFMPLLESLDILCPVSFRYESLSRMLREL
jgi:hypothetical protein